MHRPDGLRGEKVVSSMPNEDGRARVMSNQTDRV